MTHDERERFVIAPHHPDRLRRDRVDRHGHVIGIGAADPLCTVARQRPATVCIERPATPTHVRWGAMRWPELAALLHDCCDAGNLPAIERALARNALDWLIRVGVDPDAADVGKRQVSG